MAIIIRLTRFFLGMNTQFGAVSDASCIKCDEYTFFSKSSILIYLSAFLRDAFGLSGSVILILDNSVMLFFKSRAVPGFCDYIALSRFDAGMMQKSAT